METNQLLLLILIQHNSYGLIYVLQSRSTLKDNCEIIEQYLKVQIPLNQQEIDNLNDTVCRNHKLYMG